MEFNIDFEISDEQAEQFAMELYYGSDLVTDIKKYIADNQERYAKFLEEERWCVWLIKKMSVTKLYHYERTN